MQIGGMEIAVGGVTVVILPESNSGFYNQST